MSYSALCLSSGSFGFLKSVNGSMSLIPFTWTTQTGQTNQRAKMVQSNICTALPSHSGQSHSYTATSGYPVYVSLGILVLLFSALLWHVREAEQARIEESRRSEQARRDEEARRFEETRRLEEARRAAEEAKRIEEARRFEEARKAEEARRIEEARRFEEARIAEEARRIEEARRLEEARIAEEARRIERIEEARRLEEARRAEEARRIEEARRLEEDRRAEDALRMMMMMTELKGQQSGQAKYLVGFGIGIIVLLLFMSWNNRLVQEARMREEAMRFERTLKLGFS